MYNSNIPSDRELPSSQKLIKSTIFAGVVAAILLITTVLPAEYGIDPTGIGNAIGLKKMGEIKVSLEKEATTAVPEDVQKYFIDKPVQHWIPWRIVHNPKSKSTPVRVVMDASSNGSGGRCLNDLVPKGGWSHSTLSGCSSSL